MSALQDVPSEGCAVELILRVIDKHAVVLTNLLGEVSNEGNLQLAHTAVITGRLDPCQVRELAVRGDGYDLRVDLLELAGGFAEGHNLSRAHESEIKGVEE